MSADILTVMWKEWKEILSWSSGRGKLSLLVLVGVFGVLQPMQVGREWVESPISMIVWAWVPLFLVSSMVADAIAGERERHTLETLLASRLSDRAILLGKILAAMSYALGISWLSMVIGLITVNIAHGQGGLLLYPPLVVLGMVVLGVLTAGLAANVGVLVSLRAATVRQAAQTMSLAVLLLLFVPLFGVRALPSEMQSQVIGALTRMDSTRLVMGAAVVLALLDGLALTAALARFRRARLILD